MSHPVALVFSEFSAGHDNPTHPENQSRLVAIENRLRELGYLEQLEARTAGPVEESLVFAVHHPSLLETVRVLSQRGGGCIDADTYVSSGSLDASLAAAGAAVEAVDLVLAGTASRAFSIARPPGHHAERNRQLGFCLLNNIAIAAVHALSEHRIERIAIIDWDVHHGNGTQDVFYESHQVLFCSVHQWPLFPGTGMEHERGSGPGEGLTINLRLPPGSGRQEYDDVFRTVFAPAVESFNPDLLMVSAGFDAHRDDPLAMMQLSEDDFSMLTRQVCTWADALCDGRLVLCLEGGYNLRAVSGSVVAVIASLTPPDEIGRDKT